jgi:hypothetical protein
VVDATVGVDEEDGDDEEDEEPVYRGFALQVALTNRAGQAYHSVGWDGEHAIVNADQAKKCESHILFCTPLCRPLMVPQSRRRRPKARSCSPQRRSGSSVGGTRTKAI